MPRGNLLIVRRGNLLIEYLRTRSDPWHGQEQSAATFIEYLRTFIEHPSHPVQHERPGAPRPCSRARRDPVSTWKRHQRDSGWGVRFRDSTLAMAPPGTPPGTSLGGESV